MGETDADGLAVWPGEIVTEALSVPVEEGVAKPLLVVVTDWLTLGLPLKVHGVFESIGEFVLDANGDLVYTEAVKLEVSEGILLEVCVLTTVLDIEAEAVTDFETILAD